MTHEQSESSFWKRLTIIFLSLFSIALYLWWHVEIVWPADHARLLRESLPLEGGGALTIQYPYVIARGQETAKITLTYEAKGTPISQPVFITMTLPDKSGLSFIAASSHHAKSVRMVFLPSPTTQEKEVVVNNVGKGSGLWLFKDQLAISYHPTSTGAINPSGLSVALRSDGWVKNGLSRLSTQPGGLLLLVISSALATAYAGLKDYRSTAKQEKQEKEQETKKKEQELKENVGKAIADFRSALLQQSNEVKAFFKKAGGDAEPTEPSPPNKPTLKDLQSVDSDKAILIGRLKDIARGILQENEDLSLESEWYDEIASAYIMGYRTIQAENHNDGPLIWQKALWAFPVEKIDRQDLRQQFDHLRAQFREPIPLKWNVPESAPPYQSLLPLTGWAQRERAWLIDAGRPLFWTGHPTCEAVIKQAHQPGCIIIEGAAGSGKTALAHALTIGITSRPLFGEQQMLACYLAEIPNLASLQMAFVRQLLAFISTNLTHVFKFGSGDRLALLTQLLCAALGPVRVRAEIERLTSPAFLKHQFNDQGEEKVTVWIHLVQHSLWAMLPFTTAESRPFTEMQWLQNLKLCAGYLGLKHLRLILDDNLTTDILATGDFSLSAWAQEIEVIVLTSSADLAYTLKTRPSCLLYQALTWNAEQLKTWLMYDLDKPEKHINWSQYLEENALDCLCQNARGNPRRLLQVWHMLSAKETPYPTADIENALRMMP